MRIDRSFLSNTYLCVALVGLVGFTSLFSKPEEPQKVLRTFADLFIAQDAAGIVKMVHPDVLAEKEIKVTDVERFLEACQSRAMTVESVKADRRFKSEDETTERFEGTLAFRGPSLGEEYPGPSQLKMVLIWLLEDGKWWLERPVSIRFIVNSTASFPTRTQDELATRFEATLGVLESIGLPGSEDAPLISHGVQGAAADDIKRLEKLYAKERSLKGIDPNSEGVQVILKAAGYYTAGLSKLYHPDFKTDPQDVRKPVPWDMFRDYVGAAITYGNSLDKRANRKGAEKVYRQIIALGRQFLDESGGYSSYIWGLTFQKLGAQELLRALPAGASEERAKVQAFISLTSRRIDLLQTALNCVDDLSDYNCLKAAAIAAQGSKNHLFRPWGINSLSILALKGAPARPAVAKSTGSVVLVMNPGMQRKAADALNALSKGPSEEVRSFVERQKQWVLNHDVYGTAQAF